MSLYVLGQTHGNERFGGDIHRSLKKYPVAYVRSSIANRAAAAVGRRMIHTEMMGAYPLGDYIPPAAYETREARRHMRRARGVTAVLDFHNNSIGLDCMWVHPLGTDPRLLRVGAFLGFRTVMLGDAPLHMAMPNAISLEYNVPNDPFRYAAYTKQRLPILRRQLARLAAFPDLSALPAAPTLTFYQRITFIPKDNPLVPELVQVEKDSGSMVKPFDKLSADIATALGHKGEALYATTWNFRNESEGRVFGGYARQVSSPWQTW